MKIPKYKNGDRLVYMHEDPEYIIPLDHNMVVNGEPSWHEYKIHPEGGYFSYPIEGKANPCPEDFLTPYIEGQKYYNVTLPCHIYFQQRKNKK